MGDIGSLSLGGALAAASIAGGGSMATPLFVSSGVFVAQALSVMLQVGYFKLTKARSGVGKRLLRMAPLHHHLELGGMAETSVVGVFYAASLTLAAMTLFMKI